MNIQTELNISSISNDVKKIKNELGDILVGVALFGSCRNVPLTEANDIDLAIFVKGKTLPEVKNMLLKTSLKYPIKARAVNGSYGYSEPIDIPEKHYHIVVLDIDHLNKKFINLNKGCLHFFPKAQSSHHSESHLSLLSIC